MPQTTKLARQIFRHLNVSVGNGRKCLDTLTISTETSLISLDTLTISMEMKAISKEMGGISKETDAISTETGGVSTEMALTPTLFAKYRAFSFRNPSRWLALWLSKPVFCQQKALALVRGCELTPHKSIIH